MLQLGGNCISSIAGLQLGAALCGLRSLFLQANDITRIDGLDGLIALQVRAFAYVCVCVCV